MGEERFDRIDPPWRTMLDALDAQICLLDGQGGIRYVNRSWHLYAEENPHSLLRLRVGENCFELLERETGESAESLLPFVSGLRQLLSGELERFCREYSSPEQGSARWFDVQITRCVEQGRVHLLVSHREISQRRRAEESARGSERKYRRLLENLNEGIWVIDRHAGTTYANPRMAEILGVEPEDVIGRRLYDFLPASEHHRVDAALDRCRKGIRERREFDLARRDGQHIHLSLETYPTFDDGGEYAGAVAAISDVTESRKAEALLRTSEERYRSIFVNSEDGICLTEPDGCVLAANPAACRMLGRTEEELCRLGRPAVADADDPRLAPALDERARTGRFKGELTFVRRSGEKFPVELSSTIFRDGVGRALTAMIFRDVTEEKRRLAERKEADQRYKTLLDNSGTGIVIVDREGKYLLANQRAADVMNADPDAIVGKTLFDFFPKERVTGILEQNRSLIDAGTVRVHEQTYRLGGVDRTFLITEKSLPDANGRGVALQSSSIETTEQKRVYQALQESETRFRSLFERSAVGISMTYMNGQTFVNQAYCDLVGYSREELERMSWEDFTHQEDVMIGCREFGRLLLGRSETARFAQRYLRKDETTVWADVSIHLQRDAEGAPAFFITGVIDSTDLHSAQEELRSLADHLQSAREDERRGIAREIHDHFGQVLSAVKIDVDLLRKRVAAAAPEERRKELNERFQSIDGMLESSIQALRKMVSRLRPEALESLGLLAALESELREFGLRTGLTATFVSTVSGLPLPKKAAIALFRIAQEALTNVMRHAEARTVEVSLGLHDSVIHLQVWDDGKGIDSAALAGNEAFGIIGMRERTLLLDGSFSISNSPKGGTIVSIRIPYTAGEWEAKS